MAQNVTRRVNIFVNDKDANKSIAAIRKEAAKLNRTITKELTPGNKDYYKEVKRLGELRATIRNHNAAVSRAAKAWDKADQSAGKAVSRAAKAWDKADQSAGKAVGSIGKVGKVLGGLPGLAAAGGFALGLLTDNLVSGAVAMFKMGTEMEVLGRKATRVFGEALPLVTEAAEANANAMGLTVGQYIDASAAIGDLLIPMGFQREEAAKISTGLVDLSGALSEWSGGQVSAAEVTDILGKAMLGEREQLKGLGIAISENDVKTRLAEKGMDKLTGEMLQQAKAAATLELITEKSADAQAAYAANADTNIRKQAELTAKLEEVKEVIATALIPVFSRLLTAVTPTVDAITKAIQLFAKGEKDISGFSTEVQQAYNWISNLVGGFEDVSEAGSWYFSEVLTPLWNLLQGYIVPIFHVLSKALVATGIMSEESGGKFNIFKSAIQLATFPLRLLIKYLGSFQTIAFNYVIPAIGTMVKGWEILTNKVISFANTLAELGGFDKLENVDFSKFAEVFDTAGKESGEAFAKAASKEIQKTTATPSPSQGGTLGTGGTNNTGGDRDNSIKEAERKAKELARIEERSNRERLQRMERLAEEIARLRHEDYLNSLSEKDRAIQVEREKYESLISTATELHGAGSEEVAALTHMRESRIMEIENEFIQQRVQRSEEIAAEKLERLQADLNAEAELLREIEGETFEEKLEILEEQYERLIEQAQEQNLNTLEIETAYLAEKERLDKEHKKQLKKNDELLLKGEQKIQDARISNLKAAAGALSQLAGDNAKLQNAIFLFEKGVAIADVIIQAQREIAATNAAYAGIPGGVAIAAALNVATGIRTGISVATIAATTIANFQKKEGGYINVTGPDDGKQYKSKYNPRPRAGFLPPGPQLILANEAGSEYFVPHHLLTNPLVADSVGVIEAVRAGRQFVEGGFSTPINQQSGAASGGTNFTRLADAIEALNVNIENGLFVAIGEDDAREIQALMAEVNRKDGIA